MSQDVGLQSSRPPSMFPGPSFIPRGVKATNGDVQPEHEHLYDQAQPTETQDGSEEVDESQHQTREAVEHIASAARLLDEVHDNSTIDGLVHCQQLDQEESERERKGAAAAASD